MGHRRDRDSGYYYAPPASARTAADANAACGRSTGRGSKRRLGWGAIFNPLPVGYAPFRPPLLGGLMLRSSSLVLLPVGLVIGLLSGCAHAPGWTPTSGPEAQSAPEAQAVTAQDIQRAPPGEPIEKRLMGRAPAVIVRRTTALATST